MKLLAHQAPLDQRAAPQIEFSIEGGFYEGTQVLELSCPASKIFYSIDGTYPRARTKYQYDGPILLDKTMVIRAYAIMGDQKSIVTSHTYFIDEPKTTFPVVSLSITPDKLFGVDRGMFTKGKRAVDSLRALPGANFWTRREVTVNTEIFETNGDCAFRGKTGFRLFGGMSRLFPQKSMTIVARDRYGQHRIDHPVFGEDGKNRFKFLVLRNSGSDYGKSHFRDGLMTSLVEDWDIEQQDFRPSHVYINGDYWGIYNIREKVNRYFLQGHSKFDKDSIDLIEHRMQVKKGSSRHYRDMLKFMDKHSLSNPANYAYIKTQMEVENFMDHQIAQIYFDNKDAGGNIKFWRPQDDEGRWRWILYDTDWGMGLHDKNGYKRNTLKFHTRSDGPSWPNPPWSTFILRKLLENETFRNDFANRFMDHLNDSFKEDRVVARIDSFENQFLPEIDRQLERWQLNKWEWSNHVLRLRKFAKKRPEYMRMYLMDYFDTGAVRDLEIITNEGGKVWVNENVKVKANQSFKGQYFEKIPITIRANPRLGYRFVGWRANGLESSDLGLTLYLSEPNYSIEAIFEKYDHPLLNQVVINEVSVNNKKSGDWIEIYNYSDKRVELKDWILTDSKNKFTFPDVGIDAKDYLIVCEDKVKFETTFPDAYHYIGDLDFGLSKRKEDITLYALKGALVDRMAYDIAPSDSLFSINLLLPHLDNEDFENWEILAGTGTPNSANPYYVQSIIQAQRDSWMQIGGAIGVIFICIFLLYLKNNGLIG